MSKPTIGTTTTEKIANLFLIGNLEIVKPERKRLICGNCKQAPHFFEKACTPEIEDLYYK